MLPLTVQLQTRRKNSQDESNATQFKKFDVWNILLQKNSCAMDIALLESFMFVTDGPWQMCENRKANKTLARSNIWSVETHLKCKAFS